MNGTKKRAVLRISLSKKPVHEGPAFWLGGLTSGFKAAKIESEGPPGR
jgi:hypothetical protein